MFSALLYLPLSPDLSSPHNAQPKLDQLQSVCSLTEAGMCKVVNSLLTELIFTGGSVVKSTDLLELLQKRYEVTLNATGISTINKVLHESFQVRGRESKVQSHHMFVYACVFLFRLLMVMWTSLLV